MTCELITGHAGAAHVSSTDAGWYNAGTVGSGKYVLDTGTQFAANVQSANVVQIGVGDAVFEGRHVRVSATENVAIDNGAQGVNRNDLICIKYEYDSSTDVETASIAVIKGTAVSGTPSDPTIPSGSILNGSATAYMALWRIPITGLTVGTPEKMYGDVLVTLDGLVSRVMDVAQIPNIPASKVTSGTFAAARIPDIDASKVASGTLDVARIPNLPASKTTSGTFSADRIPGIPASKVTSGAFDIARIPNMPASKITSGTLPVARGGTGKTSGTVYMADTLYSSSGVNSNITLSASAANYTMMEIFFRDNDNHYSSTKVYSPNGKVVNLSMSESTVNANINIKRRDVTISGTAINTQSYAESDGFNSPTATNNIFIYAVVGYK